MVHVHGPMWVAHLDDKGVTGSFGPLCPAGQTALPLHSVLVVAATDHSFFVLDPWYSRDGQPFEVSDTELSDVLTGFSSTVIDG